MKKTVFCVLLFSTVIICYGRQINPNKNIYWWWNSKRAIAFKAIIRNDYPTFYRMLKKGLDVNAFNDRNSSLLSFAAGHSRSEMVSLLLSKGADPDKYPKGSESPLFRAAHTGRIDICKELLKYGADPNLPGDGRIALNVAVENGNYTIAEILLKAGSKLDFGSDRESILHIASRRYSTAIIKLLLRYGAKINTLHNGKTALALAVDGMRNHQFNSIAKAKILLAVGAKVNLFKNNYLRINFPLYLAVETGNTELVELLISHGADVNKKIIIPTAMSCQFIPHKKRIKVKAPGFTPLSAAIKRKYLPMVKLLLKHGAKATKEQLIEIKKLRAPKKPEGRDLFKVLNSGKYNRYESIKSIIAAGADINRLNCSRQSLLEKIAYWRGSNDLIKLLLKHGAKYKSEALRYAVETGNVDVVRLLLKHGADPNFISRRYCFKPTAIFCLRKNAAIILPLLLKAGADVKQLNSKGEYAPAVFFYRSLIKDKLDWQIINKSGIKTAESILENDCHELCNVSIRILIEQGVDRQKIRKLAEKYNKKNLLFLLDNVWEKGD